MSMLMTLMVSDNFSTHAGNPSLRIKPENTETIRVEFEERLDEMLVPHLVLGTTLGR